MGVQVGPEYPLHASVQIGNLCPALGSTNHGTDSEQQNITQLMVDLPGLAKVLKFRKLVDQTVCIHVDCARYSSMDIYKHKMKEELSYER